MFYPHLTNCEGDLGWASEEIMVSFSILLFELDTILLIHCCFSVYVMENKMLHLFWLFETINVPLRAAIYKMCM